MRRLHRLAVLPVLGWLVVLVSWGRLISIIDSHEEPASLTVRHGQVDVRPGNLGDVRHVRQMLLLLTVLSVCLIGAAATELAAAGHGVLAAGTGVGMVWTALSLPTADLTGACGL